MKIGTICYATDSGLGILAKAFYDHGIVTDPMVIRHGHHETHDEWYPGAPQITNLRDPRQRLAMESFCAGMDVMLFFETPFHWPLIDYCRRKGVKTAMMVMHECMPEQLPAMPDLFLCPSELDLQWARNRYDGMHDPIAKFVPVPVDVPWRQRTKAEVFVHNAGHGGLKGRNGTTELIEALQYVRSPAQIIIRSQVPIQWRHVDIGACVNVDMVIGTKPIENLYADGDVFIFPEKFNGLSLPLQEARAAGMLVMCGDRFPMNTWLPREPLISVAGYRRERIGPPYSQCDCAEFDPRTITAKIDEWYGRDISEYSAEGKVWADQMSWANLGPFYKHNLEDLCER